MAQWSGSSYKRGGTLKTKWGTTFKKIKSYRNANNGIVHSTPRDGEFLGVEETGKHSYGYNPKPNKKKQKWWIKGKKMKSHYRHRRKS